VNDVLVKRMESQDHRQGRWTRSEDGRLLLWLLRSEGSCHQRRQDTQVAQWS